MIRPHWLQARVRLQNLRLASGLVMFTFVTLHLVNHACGLISVAAMNHVQDWRLMVTQWPPITLLLVLAIITHLSLALTKLAQRHTLRMARWEATQIASGLLIPLLLLPHVVSVNYFSRAVGADYSYTSLVHHLWPQALTQSLLVLIVWTHGCIGLHFWQRHRPAYRRWSPVLQGVAVAMPLLAIAGFITAARELQPSWVDPAMLAKTATDLSWPSPDAIAVRDRLVTWSLQGFVALLAVALLGFTGRAIARRTAPRVSVNFVGGPTVQGVLGATLLDISRTNDIPHMSMCGGRARCSTCRVRVDEGANDQPRPGLAEAMMLAHIKAPDNVRLACQLRPTGPLAVTRLIKPPRALAGAKSVADATAQGTEQDVTILFLDIRGFTELTENRLAFDVVFLLNQFFNAVGDAIYREGGWIDKYMGDGLMAVFGRNSGPTAGAAQALRAARAIDLALEALNERLRIELAGELSVGSGLQIGMGLHAGPVIIGRIGHTSNAAVTVVGNTVNAASRLEALTKDHRCQLIMSTAVADLAGFTAPRFTAPGGGGAGIPPAPSIAAPISVRVRGLSEPLMVWLITRARDLPASYPASDPAGQRPVAPNDPPTSPKLLRDPGPDPGQDPGPKPLVVAKVIAKS
jgi:adenylate cyclase